MISVRLIAIVALLAAATPGSEGRREYGYTQAEWVQWMTDDGWDDDMWAEHCAQNSGFSAEEWKDHFRRLALGSEQWVTYWLDRSHW